MTSDHLTEEAPLKGLRVLELARILAGPWAGQTLSDLGADVLKVESKQGDDTRHWGPPFFDNDDGTQDAAYFHSCNRGKRSVVADFSSVEGQQEIRELVKDADVIIENFKVGGLQQYGLDYQSLKKINPRVVYCSITGFGQDGPYAGRPGYDFIAQGLSGVMDLTGEAEGAPQKIGVAFADIFTGLYAVIGIQAALAKREKTGHGEQVDLSLLDSMVGVLANQGMNYLATGVSPTRLGNKHPNIAPYETFPTNTSWFILAVGNDEQFRKFCDVVGLGNTHQNAKFHSNSMRVANRIELNALITEKTRQWDRDALLNELTNASVPAAPINSVQQAFEDPQVLARNMLIGLERSLGHEKIKGVRTPIKFSHSSLNLTSPSPVLGSGEMKWL